MISAPIVGWAVDMGLGLIREVVRTATLKPAEIARYDRLHADYPILRRERMSVAGYRRLDIYRHDTIVFMVLAYDDDAPPLAVNTAMDHHWRDLTDPCFATSWQDAQPIFTFAASGKRDR